MQPIRSMSKVFLQSMLTITLVSTGILFLLFISREYINFRHESETTRTAFVESQKELLQHEVTAVAEYIDYRIEQTDATIRATVRERVEEAHAVASHIQQQNASSKTPDEIQQMIKEALRNLRFNNGRGYYFIFNLAGTEQLFADRPELEGRNMLLRQDAKGEFVVRDMLDLIRKKGEGYYEYTWTKPEEQNNSFEKIAYIKLFSPYDWVIGTGEYVDDVTDDIQQEVLKRITGLKFGSEGYFFGSIEHGLPLFTNGKITKGTASIWEVTDPNGVKITQEYNRVVKNSGSGFVEYSWHKLHSPDLSPKISYVVGIPQWRWIIGAGVYLDTIEQEIAWNKRILLENFTNNLVTLLIFLVVFMLLIYLWANSFAGSIKKSTDSFTEFFTRAASAFTTIDTDQLEYEECKDIARSANMMLAARQQAEEKLRNEHWRLESIIEGTNIGTWEWNVQTGATEFNERWAEIIGYTLAELAPTTITTWQKFTHPDDQPKVTHLLEDHFSGELPYYHCELRMQHKDGHWVWILDRGRVMTRTEDGRPAMMFGTHADITERKQAEEHKAALEILTRQHHKHQSLNRMAGAIAHHFNNQLGVVIGNLDLALEDLPGDTGPAKYLHDAMQGAQKATGISGQMLTYLGLTGGQYTLLDLSETCRQILPRLQAAAPENVLIQAELPSAGPHIEANASQIQQVLTNLTNNAGEAVAKNSGSVLLRILTVLAADIPVKQRFPTDWQPQRQAYACMEVQDTGCGIAEEDREMLFDPFFSKKFIGRGLSLATVLGIAKAHGGAVSVESEFAQGSTFRVFLPLAEKTV
jgi:PAS domain S-box-containing protein